MLLSQKKISLPLESEALKGREIPINISGIHFVNGTNMQEPYPPETEKIIFGLGCFWGAERKFWSLNGVYTTAVGYCAGYTQNPTYEEVCSGMTGHNEVVLVVFKPSIISYSELLKVFWESHDPTQGMRQGNDFGTQYRSGIYITDEYKHLAHNSLQVFEAELKKSGYDSITTEITSMPTFYFAEEYHQQYLAKNPRGYCGLGGTKIKFPDVT